MITIVAYQPCHLSMIEPRAYEREMSKLAGDFSEVFARGPAFTAFDGDTAVMAGGVVPHWKGRGEAWLCLSPWFERHPKTGFRILKEIFSVIIEAHPEMVRIEAPICATMPKNMRLVRHLGFRKEGLMFRWGPDGKDYFMMARVSDA